MAGLVFPSLRYSPASLLWDLSGLPGGEATVPALEGKRASQGCPPGAGGAGLVLHRQAHSGSFLFSFKNKLLKEEFVAHGHPHRCSGTMPGAGWGWGPDLGGCPGWRPGSALGDDTGHIPMVDLVLSFCCPH